MMLVGKRYVVNVYNYEHEGVVVSKTLDIDGDISYVLETLYEGGKVAHHTIYENEIDHVERVEANMTNVAVAFKSASGRIIWTDHALADSIEVDGVEYENTGKCADLRNIFADVNEMKVE